MSVESRRPFVVLLVQSDHDNRDMYTTYLEGCRFTVVTAATTDEALVRALDADIVVTGMIVPGSYDGIELIRRIRANRLRDLPVVALTTCTFDSMEQQAIAAGCDAFLPKPCLPETLASTIREMIARTPPHKRRTARVQPSPHSSRRAS